VVVLFIAETVLMELVDEVSLVRTQRLLIVEPRYTRIPNKVNEVHLLLQLFYCFLVSLLALVATLGAITAPLTAHADKEGTHGVKPTVTVLLPFHKRVFHYFSPVFVVLWARFAVKLGIVNVGNHLSLNIESMVATDSYTQNSHHKGSKTTDK